MLSKHSIWVLYSFLKYISIIWSILKPSFYEILKSQVCLILPIPPFSIWDNWQYNAFFYPYSPNIHWVFFMSSDIIDMCTQTDRHKHTYTHTQMTEFLSIGIDKNMSSGEEEKIEQIVAVLELFVFSKQKSWTSSLIF